MHLFKLLLLVEAEGEGGGVLNRYSQGPEPLRFIVKLGLAGAVGVLARALLGLARAPGLAWAPRGLAWAPRGLAGAFLG